MGCYQYSNVLEMTYFSLEKLKSDALEDLRFFREETMIMLSIRPHRNVLLVATLLF